MLSKVDFFFDSFWNDRLVIVKYMGKSISHDFHNLNEIERLRETVSAENINVLISSFHENDFNAPEIISQCREILRCDDFFCFNNRTVGLK